MDEEMQASVEALKAEVEALKHALSETVNAKNEAKSLPDFKTGGEGLFSEEEVRHMTADEVRKNYDKIRLSAKEWSV